MNDEIIQNISIIGRYGLGMRCIENAILDSEIEISHSLRYLIQRMWEFVDSRDHTLWAEDVVRNFSPEFIEESVNETDDINLKTLYKDIYLIYENLPSFIVKMIDLVFSIGVQELYTTIRFNSSMTSKYLNLILELMKENNIDIPDFKIFQTCAFLDGWGFPKHPSYFQCRICEK